MFIRVSTSGGFGLGPGAAPSNLAQAPKFLIGSIVISLSHCCLQNDEGPAPPPIFFPRNATGQHIGILRITHIQRLYKE